MLGCAPDLLFINSMGEAVYSDRLPEVIVFCHDLGLPVRLLTNGYPLGDPKIADVAATCEEVLGELKSASENVLQRIQRPVAGTTLARYVGGLAGFRRRYTGHLILEVTVVKKYSDDDASIDFFRRASRLAPCSWAGVGCGRARSSSGSPVVALPGGLIFAYGLGGICWSCF